MRKILLLGAALVACVPLARAQRTAPRLRPAFADDRLVPGGSQACRARHLSHATAHRPTTMEPGHERLMHRYDVQFSQLDLAVERTSTNIGAGSNVLTWARNASATQLLDTIGFELHPSLVLDSMTVDGHRLATSAIRRLPAGDVQARLTGTQRVAGGARFRFQIWYHGTPAASGSAAIGDGITSDNSPSWGNRVTWTLSEPFSAYEWWPCKQILSDKLDSVAVWVTTSATNKVGANGVLENVTTLPGGKVRYEWKSRYALAYYLVSLSVAEYIDYTIYAHPANMPNGDSIKIVNYIYDNPQTLPNFQADIDDTAPLIENYSTKFGLYPFWREKYGHSMAPLGGGMEHQTMTTLGSFNFTLTAHELFHQWFGDHVTCRSWRDIWLNESFASYGEYLSLEALRGPVDARQWLTQDAHQTAFQAVTGSIVVPDTFDVGRIFDYTLTYRKGASVIHMLRHVVNNDSAFFAALAAYQQQFAFSTATTADLRQSLETSLQMPLGWFFDQWITGEGFPRADVRWNQVGTQLVVESNQSVTAAGITPFFRMPIEFEFTLAGGGTQVFRLEQTQPLQRWTITLPTGTAQRLTVDPLSWNLLQIVRTRRDTALQPTGLAASLTGPGRLSVFPNPCADYLRLPASAVARTAEVFDLAGRRVRHSTLPAEVDQLPTADLARGCYVLRLTTADGVSQQARFNRE